MHIFNRFLSSHKARALQIGMSEDEQYRCLIWQENQQINVHWQDKKEPLDLLQAVGYQTKFVIIRPIPDNYIWKRTLRLPLETNQEARYKQIIQILKNELPIELENIYFDYITETDLVNKSQLIRIYSLRKNYAKQHVTLYPTILDSELFCYLRGIKYLNPEYIYKIESIDNLIVNNNTENIQIIDKNTQENLINLDNFLFPENTINKYLYLLALGSTLWK
ncbi:hypothetical protein A6B43_06060 [Vespertiliibacter pulmonis]|uniref:Competence protein A n=1 Tax=Vespertiliibacter pulmonis TaxID=1443036 RepID=A0A3N4WEW0_9PAST|nr:hypothetical protein [Vespertiliibacter pulmonis]QLB21114.1 hypothetical protein A6B43_06060 [Vespertiliibacter pulmonis]RPE83784.1 hypothetical protein EDC46_0987 [Vespertiliibacter pulmonis]